MEPNKSAKPKNNGNVIVFPTTAHSPSSKKIASRIEGDTLLSKGAAASQARLLGDFWCKKTSQKR